MGFFDSLISGARGLWGGLKSGFNKVLDLGNTVRNGVQKGWDFVKNIPVIGNIAKNVSTMPIPIIGQSLSQIADKASNALDTGNEIGRFVNQIPS
jgi:hypothetical protein